MATNAALNVYAPIASSSVAVGSAASSFKSLTGISRVWMKATTDARVRFASSSSGTVTAGDIYLSSGVDYVFDLRGAGAASTSDVGFKTIRVSSNGTLFWASVG